MVEAILNVIGKDRRPISVPRNLLLGLSYPLLAVERTFRVKMPINPVRVRKLLRPNNVWPEKLKTLGYRYSYTLQSAFQDWKTDVPQDFA
jgi:GlcNAc-P-P-Und epimerase